MIVKWQEATRCIECGCTTIRKGSCIAAGRLDPAAWSDETLCGNQVILRQGSAPGFDCTCKECKQIRKGQLKAKRRKT